MHLANEDNLAGQRIDIKMPLVLLGILFSIFVVWKILDLPSTEEMTAIAKVYFEKYGILMVFISAIIEGVIMAGWYYPGSVIIFLGVIFSAGNIPKVIAIILAVSAGLFIAYVLNYLLGKYGWYRLLLRFGARRPLEKAQNQLSHYGPSVIFLTYWHPNFAALTATAAGILHIDFKKFLLYSILATFAWCAIWGTMTNFMGEAALNLMGLRFALIIIGAWILGIFFTALFRNRHAKKIGIIH